MKKILYLVVICVTAMTSCKKYLDIIPDDIATLDYAFRDRVGAEKFLFTCYSFMPFRSSIFDCPGFICSDEIWTNNTLGSISDNYLYQLRRYGNNVSNPLLDFWDGINGGTNLWQGIRDCNIFMDNISKVRGMEEFEKRRWIAEVKFLKAYYHFFLLRMYGPIPVIRKNLSVSAGPNEVAVYREPIDSVVHYIVNLLDQATPDLPLKITDEVSEMGRITQPIALTLKAKVLVMAASPLFNGNHDYAQMKDNKGRQLFNQTYDPDKWARASTACKNAIDTCHLAGIMLYHVPDLSLGLSDSTRQVLLPGLVVTDKWNIEQIWGIARFDSRNMANYTIPVLAVDHRNFVHQQFQPTLQMVETFYSNHGVPIDEDVTYDYDHRYSLDTTTIADKYYMQPNFVTAKLHLNREPRFYGSVAVDGGWWFGLGRNNDDQQWPLHCKYEEPSGYLNSDRHSSTSFYIKKLVNFRSAYSGTSFIEEKWDFPLFRLSDLYLLYAEALNETLDVPNAEVYKYVDMVRERAGLKSVEESWPAYSKYPNKYTTKEGMRDIIHRERTIELAFEAKHFWDVRRWKEAVHTFNEPVQGWHILEKSTNGFYQIKTIAYPKYTQRDIFWPIKESDIITNQNLVQNPGW